MSTALTVIETPPNLPAVLGPDLAAAVDLAKAEKALSTRRAYGTDFRLFKAWCDRKGASSLPASPETVAAFLAFESKTAKPSTLGRRIAAMSCWWARCRYPATRCRMAPNRPRSKSWR